MIKNNNVNNVSDNKFTFIDLFCGIGGFHQAMIKLGGKCVFASEIDKDCIETYKENYKIDCNYNIKDFGISINIPQYDVLCAGFPCQSFSKAGNRLGFEDETKGTLFFEIERVIKMSNPKPKYLILENVKNILTHDNGKTYSTIMSHLKALGYRFPSNPIVVSPHQLGVPQLRERVIILGKYDPDNVSLPLFIENDIKNIFNKTKEDNSIYSIINENNNIDYDNYKISSKEIICLNIWNEFISHIKKENPNIKFSFPIWLDYLKFNDVKSLDNFPKWKQNIIKKNQELYKNNKKFIDDWYCRYLIIISYFTPTQKKLEWQAGNDISSIYDGLIQFRPSGIRVKRPNCFSTLVAIGGQLPIIGKYKRRLTPKEAMLLQSFDSNFILHKKDSVSFKQFGNSVNVEVIKKCAEILFNN